MVKREIVFATGNENKLNEIRQIVGNDLHILGLNDIGCKDELPETSDTLQGNALQKARYVAANYHVACFADDTGLEVEALHGAPGVYSARYAGLSCNAEDNIRKLLSAMTGFTNRKACFRTVIAWVDGNNEQLFEGVVTGQILTKPAGTGGFGYDAVFRPEGHELGFAEMSPVQKNAISHRRKALDAFLKWLFIQGLANK